MTRSMVTACLLAAVLPFAASAALASELPGRTLQQATQTYPVAATPAIANTSLPSFTISADFDGGSLELVKANSLSDIQINLKPDPYTKLEKKSFRARWYFRVTGAKGKRVKVTVLNANETYVYLPPPAEGGGAWQKLYKAKATYDKYYWFQVRTAFDAAPGHLVFELTPKHDSVFFAYYPHYTVERMDLNVAKWQQDPRVRLSVLGQSLDGRDINLLRITDGVQSASKKKVWIVSGQHPGEDMHSAWTEGFINRALESPINAYSRQLLAEAVLYIVPQINPDGIFRGHHRTNAIGYNLNRMWNQSAEATSPEVLVTQAAMYKYGVDMFLDIHGDENENYNLMLYPAQNLPALTAQLNTTIAKFDQFLIESSGLAYRGIQYSYDPNEYGPPSANLLSDEELALGSAALSTADAWTANTFQCLGTTVEMPFADLIDQVDWTAGWSLERSASWGADFVQAIVRALPYVRGDGPPPVPAFSNTVYPENPAFTLQAKLVDPLALSV